MKKEHLQNYWNNNNPKSVIFHTTLGTSIEGAITTLKQRGLSYNYLIQGGEVVELVPPDKSAWHAGVVSKPNSRAKSFFLGVNPNKASIGIAFVKYGEPRLTEQEVETAQELLNYLGGITGYRYTEENCFAHNEITFYKPKEVTQYKYQVVGNNDNKGIEELQLKLHELLKVYLKLLMQKLK